MQKKFSWVNERYGLIILFAILAIFRLFLSTSGGAVNDWDEKRYFLGNAVWQNLFAGDLRNALGCFFQVHGRPGFVLISLLPTLLQKMLILWGGASPIQPHFFDIPRIFFTLFSLGNILIYYNILKVLFQNARWALLGTMVYGFLINTNYYLRHLFPYEPSLFLYFLSLYLILNKSKTQHLTSWDIRITGLLNAVGFLIYPGYGLFNLINLALLLALTPRKIKVIVIWTNVLLLTMIFIEVLATRVGKSYFHELTLLSSTINHGSFAEGYTFLFDYLYHVEGVVGIVLFIFFILYVSFYLWREDIWIKAPLVAAITFYLLYASSSVFLKTMVFYGRLLHMFLPFVVLGAVGFLRWVKGPKTQKALTGALIALSCWSFINFAVTFLPQEYPRDIYIKYLSNISAQRILFISTTSPKCLLGSPSTANQKGEYVALAVNFESYPDITKDILPIPAHAGMVLVKDILNPVNFTAYQFENYVPDDRSLIRQRKIHTQLFLLPQHRVAP